MNTIKKAVEREDAKISVKIKLSALWVAMMLLYIYADILHLYSPGQIQEMLNGLMGPFPVTQGALLAASILMILPAIMVFLSLAMKPSMSRWTNITLSGLYMLVNISNLIGETWAYYILFGIIEIMVNLLIIWYAWKWPKQEA